MLTKEQVLSIRLSDDPLKVLANRYGVSRMTIWRVRNNKRHAGDRRKKLSDEDVSAIRASPQTCTELARQYEVSKACISRIQRGLSRA